MALLDLFNMKYPSTDFHELNLDWCISAILQLQHYMEEFTAGNKLIFADPLQHDLTKTYAKNTIVLDDDGNAYLSLDTVPKGVQLSNAAYWLMVFNFEDYTEKANKNFTDNYFRDTTRTPYALEIGDWVVLDDVLYEVTVDIPADGLFEVGVNIVHFTVEQFLKDFTASVIQIVNQYKNDIDASELLYRQQLAQDIANTTASLQAQLDAAIAGITVDSEVINARVGNNNYIYSTLGDAIRSQVNEIEIGSSASKGYLDISSLAHWEVGTIITDGSELVSTTRIRSNFIDVREYAHIIAATNDSNYQCTIFCYDDSFALVDKFTSFQSDGVDFIINPFFTYVRFVIRKSDDSTADVSFGQYLVALCSTVNAHQNRQNAIINSLLGYHEIAWFNGSLDASGAMIILGIRIRTECIDVSNIGFIKTSVDPDYRYLYYIYDASMTVIASSGAWLADGTTIDVRQGAYVRLLLRKSDNSSITTTAASKIKVLLISETLHNSSAIENVNVINLLEWENGTITSAGAEIASANRLRSDYLSTSCIDRLIMSADSGYQIVYHEYDNNLTHLSTNYWGSNYDRTLSDNIAFVRFVVRKTDDSNIDTTILSHFNASTLCTVKYLSVNDVGSGNKVYYGNKINFDFTNETRKGNSNLFIDISSDNGYDVTNINYYKGQSIAISGDYLFIFFGEGEEGVVLDKDIGTFIAQFSYNTGLYNHQNAASFTNIYYDPDDEFPLIAISQYFSPGYCLLFRITRSGSTFTFTLINKIKNDLDPQYGNSWSFDNSCNRLVVWTYINGNYTVTTDNPIHFFIWDTPDVNDILSGTEITLNVSDAIAHSSFDYSAIQEFKCKNGLCYATMLNYFGLAGAFVIDPVTSKMFSYIPADNANEVEGIENMDNSILIMYRNGVDNTEPNPLQIYKFTP